MNTNLKPTEEAAIVAAIDPDATAASTVATAWVAAKDFSWFLAAIAVGTLGANATVDAKVEQAQDDTGTGAKDITGKAITQLTQAGTDDSDKQALINVNQEDLDNENAFTHLRLSITVGTATSDIGALLLGFGPAYYPASENDAASVAEIN